MPFIIIIRPQSVVAGGVVEYRSSISPKLIGVEWSGVILLNTDGRTRPGRGIDWMVVEVVVVDTFLPIKTSIKFLLLFNLMFYLHSLKL